MKLILALLASILLACTSFADVDINLKHRMSNRPGGYCVWCSMETIGRFYGIESLHGIVDWYVQYPSQGAGLDDVRKCCENLGVKYKTYTNADMKWLKEQVDNGVPVIVGTIWHRGIYHAYIVVDVDDEWVKYIDSNDIHNDYWHKRSWFESKWRGWAITIDKDQQ